MAEVTNRYLKNDLHLVENKADRWAISSNLGNYQMAKDGSLTLYIQH